MAFYQMVKMRSKPGSDFDALDERWNNEVGRQPGSGWVKSTVFANAADANEVYFIVEFESEEKARANETSAAHSALMGEMMSMVEGEPSYVDLNLVKKSTR